jgi:hypothetical protein
LVAAAVVEIPIQQVLHHLLVEMVAQAVVVELTQPQVHTLKVEPVHQDKVITVVEVGTHLVLVAVVVVLVLLALILFHKPLLALAVMELALTHLGCRQLISVKMLVVLGISLAVVVVALDQMPVIALTLVARLDTVVVVMVGEQTNLLLQVQ